MHLHRIRTLASAAALAISSVAIALPPNAAAHRSHSMSHHRSHRRSHPTHHVSGGIPQHNGGDHDSDNNGGPSDGDGNF
jgi:hypothetical protein